MWIKNYFLALEHDWKIAGAIFGMFNFFYYYHYYLIFIIFNYQILLLHKFAFVFLWKISINNWMKLPLASPWTMQLMKLNLLCNPIYFKGCQLASRWEILSSKTLPPPFLMTSQSAMRLIPAHYLRTFCYSNSSCHYKHTKESKWWVKITGEL